MKNIIKQTKQYNYGENQNEQNDRSLIRVHYDLLYMCNMNCEYCYARKLNKWNQITPFKTAKSNIDKFKKLNRKIQLILLGGEPTLYPKYKEFLEYTYTQLDSNLIQIGIISNGCSSKFNESFIDFHIPYKKKFFFSLSFHPSQMNKEKIEIFKKNLLHIKELNFIVTVNVMLLSKKYQIQINNIIDFCNDNNIHFVGNYIFNPIEQNSSYNNEQDYKEWLKEINKKFINPHTNMIYTDINNNKYKLNELEVNIKEWNKFKNWSCNNNNFEISSNSNKVTQFCTEIEYEIEDIPLNNNIICPLEKCVCSGLISDIKEKNEL